MNMTSAFLQAVHDIGSDGSSSDPVSGCNNKSESVISLQIKLDSSLCPKYIFDPMDILVTTRRRCISQKQVIETVTKNCLQIMRNRIPL